MGFGAATDDGPTEERVIVTGSETGTTTTVYGGGWLTAGAVIVITIVALGARLYLLGGRSLWLDEILSAQPAHLSGPGEVIAWSQAAINQMPIYYFFVWLLGRWGDSEFILRLPSTLAGTAAVVAVYFLGRRLFGNRTGLVAAVLTAIMPYAVWYSQEARNYSLFMLLTTAQMYFAITAVKRGKVIDWIGLGVFTTLNLYTHYLALATTAAAFVLIGGVLASDLLRSSSNKRRVILVSAFILLSGAGAFIPWRTLLRAIYVDMSDALAQARPTRLPAIAAALGVLIALAFFGRMLERQRQSVKLAVATLSLVLLMALVLAGWLLGGFASRPLPLLLGGAIATGIGAFGVASFLLLRAAVSATPGAPRRLDLALLTGSLVIAAYVPWLPTLRVFLSQPGQSLGVTYSGGGPGFSVLVTQLAGLGLSGPTLIAFLTGLVVVGVWFFKGRPLESILLALWLSVPILLLWLSVHGAILGIDNRYLNSLFPAAMIVTAAGIDGLARALERLARHAAAGRRLDGRRLGLVTGVALVGLTLVQALPALASSYSVPKHDYRGVTEHIARSSPANSVVLALGNYSDWTVICLDYYLRELHSSAVVVDGTRVSSDTVGRLAAGGAVWGVIIFPSAEQLALVLRIGDVKADYVDATNNIHIVRVSDPGLSAADQARTLLRWELPLEPGLSASLNLLDVAGGRAAVGSNLVADPPTEATNPRGWALGPGATVERDVLHLTPTVDAHSAQATVSANVNADEDYNVAFEWRNTALIKVQEVEVVAFDGQGRPQQISPAGSGFSCRRSDAWTSSYFAFRAPPHASSVTVFLRANGLGDAEFRALQLRAILDQP